MREKSLIPGDLLVGQARIKHALLIKQTRKYYYFNIDNCMIRSPKRKVWRYIDTGRLKVVDSSSSRKKNRKDRILDLHGTKHKDVDEKVRRFLNFVELPCTIITGNSQKMKDLVNRVVTEYEWHSRQSLINLGEIIIEEKSYD